MGLSNAFDKSALSAASVLHGFDYERFRSKVSALSIGIAFDKDAASRQEGRTTLELLTNLLARQYGTLRFEVSMDGHAEVAAIARYLTNLAREINPLIDARAMSEDAQGHRERIDVRLAIGSMCFVDTVPTIYVGSNRWEFGVSVHAPINSGTGENPFGAAAAACLGAAALFRMVFAQELARGEPGGDGSTDAPSTAAADVITRVSDPPVRISLLSMAHAGGEPEHQPPIDEGPIAIDETYLVGVGAIGNAATWVLGRTPRLTGTLHLVDHEVVEPTNLQRYLLTSATDVGHLKVDVATVYLNVTAREKSPALVVSAHARTWSEVAAASPDRLFPRVLLALDSAEARIGVQGSLPAWVANAWTQPGNLGVSRHPSFTRGACIACLYGSAGARKSKDMVYFDALGGRDLPELMEIRELLHSRRAVGEAFLRRTAERLGVPFEPLAKFAGEPLESFYHDALCGGIVLRLGGASSAKAIEVPLPFQSALAGVMLAAELVLDAMRARSAPLPCRTEIDLLRPIAPNLNVPAAKSASGFCICQDAVYLKTYGRKYSELVAGSDSLDREQAGFVASAPSV